MNFEIDHVDRKILKALQLDARLSMTELSRQLNLSQPATAERVRKLEDANIITGYHARINTAAVGLGIHALVRLGRSDFDKVQRYCEKAPEVRNAHNITGNDCWLIEISVRDVTQLDAVITKLNEFGETATSIILRTVTRDAPVTTYSDDTLRPQKKVRG